MDLDLILALIIGLGCLIGLGIVARRLWLAAKNPTVAYHLGRKVRRTVESSAHTAGQVSGAMDGAAGVVARAYREGRDSARSGRGSGPGGMV